MIVLFSTRCIQISHGKSVLEKNRSEISAVEEQFAAFFFWKILWKLKKSFFSKFNYELHTKNRLHEAQAHKSSDTEIHMNLQYFASSQLGLRIKWQLHFKTREQRNLVIATLQLLLHLLTVSQLKNTKERTSHSNLESEPKKKKDVLINDCYLHPTYNIGTVLGNLMELN